MTIKRIAALAAQLCELLDSLDTDQRISALNDVRRQLHKASPFADQPVDLVLWEKSDTISANDYNPNAVARPEMILLAKSIKEDGYTQPIVTWRTDGGREVVDGYHRYRTGTSAPLAKRLMGYLPVTEIRAGKTSRADRIASTIRHNRARGSHAVNSVVDIVSQLCAQGVSDAWILKSLGMDADELLRLKQVSGLAELFSDREFSRAWTSEDKDGDFYR